MGCVSTVLIQSFLHEQFEYHSRRLTVYTAPSDQNAVDIMRREWASRFPGDLGNAIEAGQIPLFEDSRIIWAIEQLGGITGFHILELGPLEGGHSYMLEQNGAASVFAVEGNTRAYIKCLITKEVLGLKRVKFGCGDFCTYLSQTSKHFDMILASGVLYHMRDPVSLIAEIARHTNRVYLWTHYWDQLLLSNPALRHKFPAHVSANTLGFSTRCTGRSTRRAWISPAFAEVATHLVIGSVVRTY